jgi:hypothetical protein
MAGKPYHHVGNTRTRESHHLHASTHTHTHTHMHTSRRHRDTHPTRFLPGPELLVDTTHWWAQLPVASVSLPEQLHLLLDLLDALALLERLPARAHRQTRGGQRTAQWSCLREGRGASRRWPCTCTHMYCLRSSAVMQGRNLRSYSGMHWTECPASSKAAFAWGVRSHTHAHTHARTHSRVRPQ